MNYVDKKVEERDNHGFDFQVKNSPNLAGRVLNMKEQLSLVSLDDKGPVTPSGPSTCTYIPGTGGTNCPPVKEINVAGNALHLSGETYPRLVVPFGVSKNQH
ncbi:hypothetical protein JHK82_028593 [Glycine max]|nr:hypothetical protein JHK85_029260 [Glycine max]KAG5127758.1 hypothetical protein JHK82_028593 [Glycine max]